MPNVGHGLLQVQAHLEARCNRFALGDGAIDGKMALENSGRHVWWKDLMKEPLTHDVAQQLE
jgi:hypothetical protein